MWKWKNWVPWGGRAPENFVCRSANAHGSKLVVSATVAPTKIKRELFRSSYLPFSLPNCFNKILKNFLGSNPDLCELFQVDVENQTLENYGGPSEPVDFILLANVLGILTESAEYHLTRCLQWLKSEGHLVIIQNTTNPIFSATGMYNSQWWI